MSEKSRNSSTLRTFIFTSPWLPLIFVALFAFGIYAEYARLPIPQFLPTPRRFILFNNFCFLLVIALRFAALATRLRQPFRYDAGDRSKAHNVPSPAPIAAAREKLAAAGFIFDPHGYGEKRTLALPAMTLVYGGILLALLVGSYDNYRHFSGVFFQGEGAPSSLDDKSLYFNVTMGPLSSLNGMPKLQVKKIIYKDSQWPDGAVDMVLYNKNNAVVAQGMVARGGKPLVYKGLEYHLGRFLTDVPLLIATDNLHLEFEETLKVQPMDAPQGIYSYYASFKGHRLLWDVLYDPATKSIKLLGGKNGKNLIEGDYHFGHDTAVRMGEYIVKVPWLTEWTEVHVVRTRHMPLVYIGVAIALAGVLLRILFHPQRVWLEETPEGCRVWAAGGEARKAVER